MARTRRTVSGQKLYQFDVPRVTLINAIMYVEASSLEEARAKAFRNEWIDVDWGGGLLSDWEVDYDSVEEA